MSPSLKRLLAVGVAAAVAFVGPVATTPAQAASPSSAVTKASKWLVKHQPAAADGYGALISSTLGLAVLDTTGGAATARKQVAVLSAGAAANVTGNPGRAATVAILARIMHLDAKKFGGIDLTQVILDGSHLTSTDPALAGQVGEYGGAYSQALAIIALKRAKVAVPEAIVTNMLRYQDASGAFGYLAGSTFIADPDSTALALQALAASGKKTYKAEIARAVAWAKKTQKPAGYWESWSPVDTTSLLATSLKLVGKGYGKARSWLRSQQLADGGFPATLGGTTANPLATSNAAFLLTGKTFLTASYKLKGYTASPRPWITGSKRVGSTLIAHTGTWKPKPQLAYQWLRNGHKIAGATARTYVLTSADRDKHIRVKVTATGFGLKQRVEVSKPTRTVRR